MDKIELKKSFISRLGADEKDYPKIIEKLQNTFQMIDQMNELDLEQFEPLNNPLELTNISREDKDNDRNQKKDFLKNSPKSDEDYFVVPKIVE